MLEENVRLVLDRIRPDDAVLDIGGWARPFNRADWVLDAMPYETRGSYGPSLPAQGGAREHFTQATWLQRDVCAREPFPFADKAIDFVACSHTLEDLRDPLWVCSEMVRIAKRGYIEVPSRIAESSRGVEPGIVGWSHHRWLIEIADQAIVFRMKYHTIHSHWRYSLPAGFVRGLPACRHVQWLLWEDRFEFREDTVNGVEQIAEDLEGFVARIHPYPRWLVRATGAGSALGATCGRVYRGVRRRLLPKPPRAATGRGDVPG